MSNHKSALITGVSTGIGFKLAEKFIRENYHVFGSVRKIKDADPLAQKYPDRFTPLVFDVTDNDAIKKSVDVVEEKLGGMGLNVLINNAGIAKGGPLLYIDIETIKQNFDVNVLGVIRVTQAFAPLLGAIRNYKHKPGKIINISSVSGKFGSPFVGPYVGSKHALEGMSHSLRRELLLFGIDVIVVGPGVVKTPIWQKADDIRAYNDTPYRQPLEHFVRYIRSRIPKGLDPEDISNLVYSVAESHSPKTRYSIVPNYLTNWLLPRILPDRLIDRIIGKQFGLKE